MFNNIIYFIIVLLVYTTGQSERDQTEPLLYSISMIFLLWLILGIYCRTGFKRLVSLYERGAGSGYAAMYNRLVLRLSLASIFIFSLDVFAFNLKFLIESVPVAGNIYILQGLSAVLVFILYLSTVWYFANPAYNIIFNTDIRKKAFIFWNIRLNLPVIFPWLLLSIGFDFVSLSPWPELNSFLERPSGQILFFGIFLATAVIFLPVLVQFFWGCRPIDNSLKAESIRDFFRDMGFRYRELVNWPILGGKMMTAGIMGVIPRFRYVLITESLMEVLNPSELNAVMAHEAGHAKYNHQLLLSLLFIGYFILSLGFFDPEFYFTVMGYLVYQIPGDFMSDSFYFVFFAVPMLVSLIVYFRFVMGFFMRHFERQADTYAALTIGDPSPIISSLEKIALLSGKTRDVPSWHHFSIKERVDFLEKSFRDPATITGHRRLLRNSLILYITVILALSYLLYLTPVKEHISNELNARFISVQMEKHPDKAIKIYEKLLSQDRKQATVLNNLAWLLLTTDDQHIKDIKRGLELAEEAVELERLPEFLDTLAEAYWANGNNKMAVQIEKEAIMRDRTDNPHYSKQLEKFINEKRVNL
jgi:Zn-dependent protease with chaperone function